MFHAYGTSSSEAAQQRTIASSNYKKYNTQYVPIKYLGVKKDIHVDDTRWVKFL